MCPNGYKENRDTGVPMNIIRIRIQGVPMNIKRIRIQGVPMNIKRIRIQGVPIHKRRIEIYKRTIERYRNYIFATNSDLLIHISLNPNVIHLLYIYLYLIYRYFKLPNVQTHPSVVYTPISGCASEVQSTPLSRMCI